jgi:Lrp/AsnC family transcriptional regulator, leucine-responsive regulatory protein
MTLHYIILQSLIVLCCTNQKMYGLLYQVSLGRSNGGTANYSPSGRLRSKDPGCASAAWSHARHRTCRSRRISKTPCQVRLKRLTDRRVIRAFRAIVDPVAMGLDHIAFCEVKLSDTRETALRDFNEAVQRIAEVEECHMIASSFDYLLKVRTTDIRRYRLVLAEKISALAHVASTSTYVAMETVKDDR